MKHIFTAAGLLSLALPLQAQIVNNGSTITVNSGAQVKAGVDLQNTSGGTFQNNGTVAVTGNLSNAGTLKGNGTFSYSGSITNTGTISPGNDNAGQMNITGNFNNGTGTLAIEIGGPVAGTSFDRIAATGSVTAGGTLNVSLINSYAPATALTFDIVTGTTATGTFSTVNLPSGWNVNYLSDRIQLLSPSPLPVVFGHFTGNRNGTENHLDWEVNSTTASTVDISLERSSDGITFRNIYTTQADAARCKKPFAYDDRTPLAGWNYYRLRVQEQEGKTSYSRIISLNMGESMLDKLVLAPNPVGTDGIARLEVSVQKAGKVTILVTDMNGRRMTEQHLEATEGLNTISLKGLAPIAAGMYQASVITEDGHVRSIKFSRQ